MGYRSRLDGGRKPQEQTFSCPQCRGKGRVDVLKQAEPIRQFKQEKCSICDGLGRVISKGE